MFLRLHYSTQETTELQGLIRESESFTEAAKKCNEMVSWFFLPFLRFLGSFEELDLLELMIRYSFSILIDFSVPSRSIAPSTGSNITSSFSPNPTLSRRVP